MAIVFTLLSMLMVEYTDIGIFDHIPTFEIYRFFRAISVVFSGTL